MTIDAITDAQGEKKVSELRKKPALSLVLFIYLFFIIVLFSISAVFLIQSSNNNIFRQTTQNLNILQVESIRNSIKSSLLDKILILKDYAQFPLVYQPLINPEVNSKSLFDFIEKSSIFGENYQLSLLDSSGKITDSTHKSPDFNYKDLPWVSDLINGRIENNIEISNYKDRHFWRLAVPVKKAQIAKGVLVCEIEILENEIKQLLGGKEDSYLGLIWEGKVIASVGMRSDLPVVKSVLKTPELSLFYQPQTGKIWNADEMMVKIGNDWFYLWNVIDDETRFHLASVISKERTKNDARKVMITAKKRSHGKRPQFIITDGLKSYIKAIDEEFHTLKRDTIHVGNVGIRGKKAGKDCLRTCQGC